MKDERLKMKDLSTLTRLVCQVAREAGTYIRKERASFSTDCVERKHAHDYVSYVDKTSEQLIVSRLRQLLPDATFLTEEGTAGLSADNPSSLCWVIDPLDGTTNFIHGYAPYAVSIALVSGTDILLGVVYEICADECYYAWQGGGAHRETTDEAGNLKDELLHVSTHPVTDALLCLQLPYNSDAYKPVIRRLIDHFYGRCASIRMIGSAAMALCYVACGRLDGYVERHLGQWDFMAGALIVSEARGRVTTFSGTPTLVGGDSVIASNGIVHDELMEEIS